MHASRRHALALCLPVVALGTTGCGLGFFCTEEARYSVVVEVVDAQGEPVSGVVVRYTLDGGESTVAPCATRSDDDVCRSWAVGVEDEGMFVVTATTDRERGGAVAFVGGDDDGCHVETQQRRIVVR